MTINAYFPIQNRHVRHLLGLYLNRKRIEQGLTLKAMAAQVELSPQSYRRIETGNKKLSDSLFEKIQSHLLLDIAELNEIRRIAAISYINDLHKALAEQHTL